MFFQNFFCIIFSSFVSRERIQRVIPRALYPRQNLTSPSYIHLVTVYAWCLQNFLLSFKQGTEATSQLSLTVTLSMTPLHLSFNLHLKVFFGSVFFSKILFSPMASQQCLSNRRGFYFNCNLCATRSFARGCEIRVCSLFIIFHTDLTGSEFFFPRFQWRLQHLHLWPAPQRRRMETS